MSISLRPHRLYSPWNSPGQNTGVGSLSLLQGIFPTQGSNPGLPRCRWILYQLSHRFKEKSCCPLGEDPALLQRLVSFIFSLDCQELIWKANNAMLSEGCYIGNRCSNSAWVHVPLRWIIPWLTSLPEALPPN